MLGLTQAGLARLAGLSTTGINNIESGQSDPKVSTMEAVRRALESAGAAFEDGMVGLRPFQVGDRVKYRVGRAPDPMLWRAAGGLSRSRVFRSCRGQCLGFEPDLRELNPLPGPCRVSLSSRPNLNRDYRPM